MKPRCPECKKSKDTQQMGVQVRQHNGVFGWLRAWHCTMCCLIFLDAIDMDMKPVENDQWDE